ncbi:winged helix DNA-binding domain-containing protein [candidate division KSB1 bacterium]|nr:winged helix DNA-binding domain-containing protein [candidate division KSB1 bacterium]
MERDIERALANRTIVRTWPMRGTLHFVAIPMQPNSRAETSKLLFPSLRFCLVSPLLCALIKLIGGIKKVVAQSFLLFA